MQPIFEYIDFRAYLKDYFTEEKLRNKYFSYRMFARKAGIKSPVFYKEVASGQKNLSLSMIEKFTKALRLQGKECVYFKYLVLFNQAKTPQEKQSCYVNLRSMENIKNEQFLNADQYDYFSNWYTAVIRELITLHDFRDDYKKIAQALVPPIKINEAKDAVNLLVKLGLIQKQRDGSYKQNNTAITIQSGIATLAVRHFNKAMLRNAFDALDVMPKEERHISGITAGISLHMYDMICSEIAAFKDRLITMISHDKKSSRVYQINMQVFPVSVDTIDTSKDEL